jgi:hypothetical protein
MSFRRLKSDWYILRYIHPVSRCIGVRNRISQPVDSLLRSCVTLFGVPSDFVEGAYNYSAGDDNSNGFVCHLCLYGVSVKFKGAECD